MRETIKIGINGFGRIGRTLFRLLQDHPNILVVAINDLSDSKTLSHLLKYDSIHGIFNKDISYSENEIIVSGNPIRFSSNKNIESIHWGDLDFVIECTGKFRTRERLQHHIQNGAKKVILSVPPQDDSIKMVVLGTGNI